MKEVSSWVKKAFDCGAQLFCVCTQDTNSPDSDVVYSYLNERFRLEELLVIKDWSSAATRHYQNFWGIYSA